MTRRRWFFLLLCLLAAAQLAPLTDAQADALDRYRWERRPLLIFAPSSDETRLRAVAARIGRRAGAMAKRDMVALAVLPDGGRVLPIPGLDAGDDGWPITKAQAQALRRRFDVAPEAFVMVLVGKDGGEKHRYPGPKSLDRSFKDIDRMPMRRLEMQREDGQ